MSIDPRTPTIRAMFGPDGPSEGDIDTILATVRELESGDTDEPEPVIDWKARSEQMFSENIRQAERYKGKIRTQGERIQELERINTEQAAQIKRMTPANEKRKTAEKLLEDAQASWAARYTEQDNVIRTQAAEIAKGKRGALEMVIGELQAEANRMARIEGKA